MLYYSKAGAPYISQREAYRSLGPGLQILIELKKNLHHCFLLHSCEVYDAIHDADPYVQLVSCVHI